MSDPLIYMLLNEVQRSKGVPFDVQLFDASGTWNKPAGATRVRVIMCGGGGGASRAFGGGGAAACDLTLPASLFGSSEAVTVGAAGVGSNLTDGGTNGGNSQFGRLRAEGGLAGHKDSLGPYDGTSPSRNFAMLGADGVWWPTVFGSFRQEGYAANSTTRLEMVLPELSTNADGWIRGSSHVRFGSSAPDPNRLMVGPGPGHGSRTWGQAGCPANNGAVPGGAAGTSPSPNGGPGTNGDLTAGRFGGGGGGSFNVSAALGGAGGKYGGGGGSAWSDTGGSGGQGGVCIMAYND